MDQSTTLTILAGNVIDGTGAEPVRDAAILIENGVIVGVEKSTVSTRGSTVYDLRAYTVMPGLINMHAHTMLPGDGTPFAECMKLPDELLLLQAHTNSLVALNSGVTTIRDCGGKGRIMFRLRDAIRSGIVPGPRFVLSGRPLTITGGHCHYFGGEVDGPDEMRRASRQLLKEGADFIKIMASGGGTEGTYPQFPAFGVDELRAAINSAHMIGKVASCHCIASTSIALALEAGTDHIEHCTFLAPDATVLYDEALAHRIAECGTYVTATLQVMAELPVGLAERHGRGEASTEEVQLVESAARRVADHLASIGHLHELGVALVAGNDAGWRNTGFDDFYLELNYLTQAGLTTLEAIHAATGRAAAACQLDDVIGCIGEGYVADLIAVGGDPLTDLSVLKNPQLVLQSGQVVVDQR